MLGGRSQRLLPVAMSMMTSYVSGLTIIGNPAEFYYHGFGYTTVMVPQLLSVPFTALILLPVFHRLGNVSIYDVSISVYDCHVSRSLGISHLTQHFSVPRKEIPSGGQVAGFALLHAPNDSLQRRSTLYSQFIAPNCSRNFPRYIHRCCGCLLSVVQCIWRTQGNHLDRLLSSWSHVFVCYLHCSWWSY